MKKEKGGPDIVEGKGVPKSHVIKNIGRYKVTKNFIYTTIHIHKLHKIKHPTYMDTRIYILFSYSSFITTSGLQTR